MTIQHIVRFSFPRERSGWLAGRECAPLAFDYYLDEHTVLMPE